MNTFPRLDDGDVLIRLSSEDEHTLVLHSFVLGLDSPFFKASLSERWAGNEELISGPTKIKWRYELRFEKSNADGILVCRPDQSSVPTTKTVLHTMPGTSVSKSSSNLEALPPTVDEQRSKVVVAHEQLFGSLYHLPPDLPMTSFAEAYPSIKTLLATAYLYDCVSPIAIQIEGHLHQFSKEIFAACASKFFRMISLSLKLKSDWMFKEAMVHLIGSHKMKSLAFRAKFESLGITELIEAKLAAFISLLRDTELKLFLEVNAESHSDACDVLAVSHFRDQVSRQINAGMGSGLAVGYARLYRSMRFLLGLFEKETRTFIRVHVNPHEDSMATDPAQHHFENRLTHHLRIANKIVHPLLKDNSAKVTKYSQFDRRRPLTFTEISDADLPWR